MCHKQKTPRTIWALLRGLARTDSAKVRLLFELCKCLGRKVMIWRVFLTVVGCFDVQNAAFTNQIGEDTNQIGEFGWMILTLHRHFIDKCEDGLRSGCWHLRSWLAWYGVFPYFCISSNCTRQLKTSFHCSRLQELSQRIINEIVAERRLKTLNCCKYKENLSILTFVWEKICIFAAQRGIFARNWVMSHII